jgi:DNA-binding CsgD family transcriptional regulator
VNAPRELRDPEAWLIALLGMSAAYAVTHDWRAAFGAGLGTLAVRVGVGISFRNRGGIPSTRLPGLTDTDSSVAYCIQRNLSDPAIARILNITLPRVQSRVQRIQRIWGLQSRAQIAAAVNLIPPVPVADRPKERWEWIAELGAGIAVMALGVALMTLPPDTPLIGPSHDAIGLVLTIGGLVFGAVSTFLFYTDKTPRQ